MGNDSIHVSAPGRLCLLGEHQDYFGLPILAAAIDLRISIAGGRIPEREVRLDLPDIGEKEGFPLGETLPYSRERDYLKSAVNILQRQGLTFPAGWDCRVRGTIPINSGTASSSSLVVAWVRFLLEAAGDPRASEPESIAELAFQAEVAEFEEPGGKMDHYASALGGIISLHFGERLEARQYPSRLGDFVLADSLIRKDTTGTLSFIKSNVLNGVRSIQSALPGFTLLSDLGPQERERIAALPPVEKRLVEGTLQTRDVTAEGERLFQADTFDHKRFGGLLNRQQDVVRDFLQISVPKIDGMIETSLESGALGAKINGSGQGGCIFAYTPGRAEEVAEALKKLDTRPHIVRIDTGVTSEEVRP
jgi:galactokinase